VSTKRTALPSMMGRGADSRAGIRGRYSPHSLPHSFALGLSERTGDVLVVQQALGHRVISSTLMYARALAERVRAAVLE
jgi:site-specific recombinase XerD